MAPSRYEIVQAPPSLETVAQSNRIHRVWGGELSIPAGGSVTLEEGLSSPLKLAKAVWQCPGLFRRTAQNVRDIEQPTYIIAFVDHGCVRNIWPEAGVVVEGGTFAVVKSQTAYTSEIIPDKGQALVYYGVLVPHHMMAPLLAPGTKLGTQISSRDGEGAVAKRLAELLFEHGRNMNPELRDKAIDLFLHAVASCLSRHASVDDRPIQVRRFDDIVQFIHEHIAEPELSAQMAAKHLRISTRYLSALIHKRGMNFPQLLRDARIARARELLVSSNMTHYTIGEIAEMAGFANAPHFTRVFKEKAGQTPSEYRASVARRSAPSGGNRLPSG